MSTGGIHAYTHIIIMLFGRVYTFCGSERERDNNYYYKKKNTAVTVLQ